MNRSTLRRVLATASHAAALAALALSSGLLAPSRPQSCARPPSLPPCSSDGGAKLALGWEPGHGACSSGVLTVSLAICSPVGGDFGWTIGVPAAPGGSCTLPGGPPDATCARTSPDIPQSGTLSVAPNGCQVVTVPFALRSCEPSPGGVAVKATITSAGGTCELVQCILLNCLKPESGFPSLTITAADSLVTAQAGGAAKWAWDVAYDGPDPTSGPHCLALTQVNGFGDELFPVKLTDDRGNVLASTGFDFAAPGTTREVEFASVDIATGTSLRLFGECPFKGVCFPGLDNEMRLEARAQDPGTGACLPVAVSAADVRAVIEGFDPLRFESIEDLGGGRMQVTWIVRGPVREPSFEVRFDGRLDVESATASYQPMPTMVPPPPVALLPTQPDVAVAGRGGSLVTMSWPEVAPRDADDMYFEDNVVLRVVLSSPAGEPHRGNVDNGATLRHVTRDGVETASVPPVRLR